MKKKIGLVLLLIVVATGMGFAKDKLTKAQVEEIYKKINAMPYDKWESCKYALNLIIKNTKEAGKDRSVSNAGKDVLNDLLGLNSTFSMFQNMYDLFGLASTYTMNGYKERSINDGAKLVFDTIDFFGGFALPGGYVRSITTAGKAALAQINNHNGQISYAERATEDHFANRRIINNCFDPSYSQFASAWYAAEYYTVGKNSNITQYGRDQQSMMRIGEYIEGLKILRANGLIQ